MVSSRACRCLLQPVVVRVAPKEIRPLEVVRIPPLKRHEERGRGGSAHPPITENRWLAGPPGLPPSPPRAPGHPKLDPGKLPPPAGTRKSARSRSSRTYARQVPPPQRTLVGAPPKPSSYRPSVRATWHDAPIPRANRGCLPATPRVRTLTHPQYNRSQALNHPLHGSDLHGLPPGLAQSPRARSGSRREASAPERVIRGPVGQEAVSSGSTIS